MMNECSVLFYFSGTPKGSSDLNVWQFDEEKTLEYLGQKVKRLSQEMLKSGLAYDDNESSSNYVSSSSKSKTQTEGTSTS